MHADVIHSTAAVTRRQVALLPHGPRLGNALYHEGTTRSSTYTERSVGLQERSLMRERRLCCLVKLYIRSKVLTRTHHKLLKRSRYTFPYSIRSDSESAVPVHVPCLVIWLCTTISGTDRRRDLDRERL